jgi:hypothetical protein
MDGGEWLYHFAQAQLVVVAVISVTLITHHPRLAVWGFTLGLFNQWAWMYSAYHDSAWGLAIVNVAYIFSYIRGIRRYRRLFRDAPAHTGECSQCGCHSQAPVSPRET